LDKNLGVRMKKIIPLLLLFSLVSACNAPANRVADTQDATQPPVAQATQSNPEQESAPQAAAMQVDIDAPLIEAPSLVAIHMLDTINGWGVTETEIVRTNDGGITWYNVTPPGITETGYMVASQAEFLDTTHAWLQFADVNNYPNGGSMVRTTDGGLTWSSTETPFSAGKMAFLDANNGWLMADLGVGAGSMAVSVFQTSDGGDTWTRQYTNDPNLEGAGDSLPMGGLKYDVAPMTMQTAWIHGVTYSTGTAYLYRTDDAGKTWSLVPLDLSTEAQGAELSVDQLRFTSATQGVLILRINGPKIRMVVYTTNDGGDTWTPALETVPGGNLGDIVSAQEIVFYGTDQFYVTQDAGVTWNVVAPDVVFGESLTAMEFASASIGWVITTDPSGHHTLYKTENGGVNWFPIIP
jgi:photosystem II stability/assembly factor-like uncharacterized protein